MTFPVQRVQNERIQEAPTTKLVADKEFVVTFKVADTTPSVLNLHVFKAGNLVANNITYFDDGFDGQEISILGDGFTTLVHDVTRLLTNTLGNKLMLSGKVYHLTRFDSKWIEDA